MKSVTVAFFAHGHKNVISTHQTTVEVTKETELSKRGNCIVAVGSTNGAIDLPFEFKEAAKKEKSKITIIIEADELKETITAKGSPQLQFTHLTDLVVRKSDYVCGRTLAIGADKASIDLSRKFVEKLQNPNQQVKVTLTVENY
ncbi:MAG: DUF371 domain-containing protein [Candidatus Bathyarchaeota archaeon]|nr:DUF371 domain-containing protein [Candidatus Bathyarchaeum tardum]WGM89967.1 MAG: DUF371 domain-containing protein [Candidatus Bathyarchaeum tardum]